MNDAVEFKDVTPEKQMWDSKKGEWVPFDIWGAHFIVNDRNEYLCLRVFKEYNADPKLGPTTKGWQSIDSSYLTEQLKENRTDEEKNTPFKSFAGYQAFYEIVKQDMNEYAGEGRISEYNNRRKAV
jgi:hypothetical protein